MRLYFKYAKHRLKSSFAYRGSFWFTTIGQSLHNIGTLFGIYLLFQRFNTLGGYSFSDILITYAIVLFVFSFDEMFFRGLDEFDQLIQQGELDKLLLRPRNIVFQICCNKIELSKVGRVILGLALLVFACIVSPVTWTFGKVLILIEMILSGIITFLGVYLLSHSITIFTIQKAEFINVFTDGGRELCYYPLDVFKKFLTKLFTFVIPFASFNFIPLRYLLGMEGATIWNIIYPISSIIFAIIGYIVFSFCLRFYKSAG